MDSLWKSFRLKILFYSLISLILALVADYLVFSGVFYCKHTFFDKGYQNSPILVEENLEKKSTGDKKNKESKEEEETEIQIIEDNLVNEIIIATGSRKSFLEKYNEIKSVLGVWIIFVIVVGIGFFVLFFQLLTKRTSDYLVEISKGIDQIATGDLKKRVPVQGEDEIANIAERLNEMTRELQVLIDNEREYEKEKSDLITNVAHDLRTPLTSIIGYLELVNKKSDLSDEEQEKYISIVYDKSKRLEKLINDLFEFTKAGADRVKLQLVNLDFKRFMEQMVEEFYPSFEEEKLECRVNDTLTDGMIIADPDLLARGIANLFSNAIKYGKDGKVIKVDLKENEKSVYVTITNYGEIIPEKDLEHIFDKFFRVEGSRSAKTGGTGLGLAILKKIVLLHHGKIQVSSDYKGTIFSIELPKEIPEYQKTK